MAALLTLLEPIRADIAWVPEAHFVRAAAWRARCLPGGRILAPRRPAIFLGDGTAAFCARLRLPRWSFVSTASTQSS